MIKQAVILCAGLGTRLRPYTDTTPKPMLPVLGRPMLEWNVKRFKESGVKEFFINLHYLPDVIQGYFGDGSKFGVKIEYSREPAILGTAGGIRNFRNRLNDEFFLIYGDILSRLDYAAMARVWQTKKDALGMQLMKRTDDYADADVAELDASGKCIAIHPKPHQGRYSNAYRMRGIAIFNKRVLDYIPASGSYEIARQLLPDALSRGEKFFAYECNEYSKGIDTVGKWREAEDFLRSNGEKS